LLSLEVVVGELSMVAAVGLVDTVHLQVNQ
jgi:hypothetical protein